MLARNNFSQKEECAMIRALRLALVLTVALPIAAPLAGIESKTPPKVQQFPATSIPLVFEPNLGQAAPGVQWLARGSGFRIGLTSDGATIEFRDRAVSPPSKTHFRNPFEVAKSSSSKQGVRGSLVQLRLPGSGGWKMVGVNPTGGISNYFIGNQSDHWNVNIPHYAEVRATGVYKGVDLVFHGNRGAPEYDFVIAPGADPRQIRLQFEGAANLRMDQERGDLVLTTANGAELRHAQPKIYQDVAGKRVSVKGGYEVRRDGTAGFTLGAYNPKVPLVIDPTVRFTTFLAGSDLDEAAGVAFDGAGNSYVTGSTDSGDFPKTGGIQGNQSGMDAFVTKLSPTGAILFSTYLGGGDEDGGVAIAADASGVYVTGRTASSDFPVRQPLQLFLKGDNDAFVTKLSPLGNTLVYSTFLGGSGGEEGWSIAVDSSQSAYVAGETMSKDFQVVRGFQFFPTTGDTEFVPINGFVAKLSPAGTSLVYSTYLGGSGPDAATGIAIDGSLSAYVTGETCSSDFPFAGLHSLPYPGTCTAFVTKLSPAGDSVIYSTYLPNDIESGAGVAVDTGGNAYVAGTAVFGSGISAREEVYVAKIVPTGALGYFRFIFGNDGFAAAHGIATDFAGNAYVVGTTSSTSLPGAPPIHPNPEAGFLMKFDPIGNGPLYTTFLGLKINGVAVNRPRPVIVQTYATIWTAGVRLTGGTAASNEDAFVVKLDEAPVIVAHQ
jgi:hypothetical protein